MKKLFVLSALLTLFSISALAEKWTGYIWDYKCAVNSKSAKATDEVNPDGFAWCAKKCVRGGSAVVFVTEDNKVLKLDADSLKKAMPHLGHRVSLSGKVDNGTLKIDEIAPGKMDMKTKPTGDTEEKMHQK